MARTWWIAGWNSGNVGTGVSQYGPLTGTSQFGNPETDDMTRPIAPSEDGAVLSELSTYCTLQQHTTMDGVIRVNGADTDLENLHSGTGVLTNLSDTVTLSSGDKVATLRRPAGAGGSSRIGWFAGVFEAPNNPKIKKHAINLIGGGTNGSEAFQSNSTTEWVNLIGRTAANQGTEDLGSSMRVRGTYNFRHLFVTVDSNTRVVDSNFVSRVNKADGAQLVVITAGVTGTFENLGDSDQVQWGDQIGAAGRNFTGGGSWNMQISGAELVDFNGRLGIQGLGDGIGQGHNPNQTRLVSLSDDFNTTFNFDHLYVVPHRMTLGFFHCPISGNGNVQETEQIVRVDNADTDVGQFTPPLTTGDFENIVDTVIVRETSVISGIRLYTGSGSSGTITYEGTISFQTTTAPRFQMEPVVFNADPLTGEPLGLGQSVCVQLGPAVAAEPPAGTMALAGLAPTIPQNAVIIPVPAGHLCLRGPLNPVSPVEIDVPAGGLVFTGQAPTLLTGISRTPPAGGLVLAGQAPQAFVERFAAPPAGALVLTGLAPTLSIGIIRSIPVGTLVLTGLAPQAFVQRVFAPPAGTLVLNGLAPTVTTGVIRAIPVGTLVLAGLAPQAFVQRTAAPPAGTLVLTGLTPSLDFELHPGAGALVLAGLTPNLFTTVLRAVPAGVLALNSESPVIAHTLPVPTGALLLQGLAPQAFRQRTFAPPAGALVLTGQLPLCITGIVRAIPTGTLVLAGLAPTVEITVRRDPPAGALILQGLVPGVFTGLLRSVPTGSLVLQGQTPTRLVTESIEVPVGTLLLAGQNPTLGFGCPVPVGALVLAGLAPTRLVSRIVAPPAGALVLTGLTPSLGFTCPAPTGALVLAGLVPTVVEEAGAITRTPPTGALVFTGQAPTVTTGFSLDVPVGSLVLAGQTPTLFEESIRQPGAGALILQGQTPTLGGGTVIDVPTGALVLGTVAPTVSHTLPVTVGGMVLTGLAPTLGISYVFDVPTGTLVLQGYVPTLGQGANPQPPSGTLTLAGLAPLVGHGLPVPVGSLVFTGLAPLAQFNTVPTGQLVLQGLAPTRIAEQSIDVPNADLRLDGYAPTIEGEVEIPIPVWTHLDLDGHTPTLGFTCTVPTGALTFAGQTPNQTPTGVLDIPTGSLVLQGLAPTLGLTSPVICPAPAALVLQGHGGADTPLVIDVPTGALVLGSDAEPVNEFEPPTITTFNLRRQRWTPYVFTEHQEIFHKKFQLHIEAGTALEDLGVQGSDPQVTLEWSDDSGRTWKGGITRSAGKRGEYRKRLRWFRLGVSRKRLYRLTVIDPVKFAFLDAYLDVEKGTD